MFRPSRRAQVFWGFIPGGNVSRKTHKNLDTACKLPKQCCLCSFDCHSDQHPDLPAVSPSPPMKKCEPVIKPLWDTFCSQFLRWKPAAIPFFPPILQSCPFIPLHQSRFWLSVCFYSALSNFFGRQRPSISVTHPQILMYNVEDRLGPGGAGRNQLWQDLSCSHWSPLTFVTSISGCLYSASFKL